MPQGPHYQRPSCPPPPVYFKPSNHAEPVPFSAVATVLPKSEDASIYRRDGRRTLSVLGYPEFGLTPAEVSRQFTPQINALSAALPGCGGTVFEDYTCSDHDVYLTKLTLSEPVDFIAERRSELYDAEIEGTYEEDAKTGTACETASDKTACEATLADTWPTRRSRSGWSIRTEYVLFGATALQRRHGTGCLTSRANPNEAPRRASYY